MVPPPRTTSAPGTSVASRASRSIQPQQGHSPPTSRASTPGDRQAGRGQPLRGILTLRAHAQDHGIHLVRGPPAAPLGCTGAGSADMTGWNCSEGDGVSYYVLAAADTDGVIDDF
jgi:hypothetical protein